MTLTARNFKVEDIKAIDEIFNNQTEFGVPSLKNVLINSTVTDVESNKVIGYGVIKLFAEAYMILDHRESKKKRAEAFKQLMQIAIVHSKDAGLEELFILSNDLEFTTILCKKYAFKRVPGELLMLDLNERESEDGQ